MSTLIMLFAGCNTTPPCRAEVAVWEDLDGDGWGATPLPPVCAVGANQAENGLDCDDERDGVNPEARDLCDGLDNDCDGVVDDGHKQVAYYMDADDDGFGAQFPSQLACEAPGKGWVKNADDCNDDDDRIHPDAQEVCAGGDEDCDGLAGDFDDSTDPDTYEAFYQDLDGDTHGNPRETVAACDSLLGYVPMGDDCDDRDPNFSSNLYYVDSDEDGYGDINDTVPGCTLPDGASANPNDCDDNDPGITIERDWFSDADGDGWGEGAALNHACYPLYADLVPQGGDCAAGDPLEHPGVPEDCEDTIDQNCNGQIDCDDPGCASFPTCVPPCADLVLAGALPISVVGSTVGQGNNESGSCGGGSAPDVVYQYVPLVDGTLTIDTIGSLYDTVLVVKEGCGGPTLGCNDDAVGLDSRVVVSVTAGVPIIIDVDGYSNNAGAYVLTVQ